MPCPAINTRQRGFVHVLPLLVLGVIILAGVALLSGDGVEFPGKQDKVLGASAEKVATHEVNAARSHQVFGVTVNTFVKNVVSDETGEILEVKPSISDWIVSLLEN